MLRRLTLVACTLFVALAHDSITYGGDDPLEPPMEPTRTQILIGMLEDPAAPKKAGGGDTSYAIKELVKLGPKAVPDLVDAILRDRNSGGAYAALALDKIGKPALEEVRTAWEKLDERQRWKLMRFRGQFDYDAVLMFAVASLDSDSYEVRQEAIRYAGQYKEPRSRDKLLELLNNDEPPLRWEVVDALTSIGGDAVVDAFVELLAPDSWAAKGEGLGPAPTFPVPWWPDARPQVIDALQKLKATKTAPALLSVLQEKGAGKGYLVITIAPALAEFEYREALPELRRILDASPESLTPSIWPFERIKSKVAEVIRNLETVEEQIPR